MKTLLAALEFPPAVGGVEKYYGNMAKLWPEEIIVASNENNQLANPRLPFFKWLPSLFTLGRIILKEKPDWVIAGEILPIGTAVWLLSKFFSFKFAVMLHGLDFSLAIKTPRKRRLAKKILQQAGMIICVSGYTAELVRNCIGNQSRIHIVHPGVDPVGAANPELVKELEKKYSLENKFVLLTVGRLVKRKGADMVLAALAAIKDKIPDLRYIIVGRGAEEKYLQDLIVRHSLESHVRLLTDVTEEEKAVWFWRSDAFIMPARNIEGDFEGFGIVYLEAGAYGKPVIAGRSGGVRDAVRDGLNGVQVDEENPEAIAEAIMTLYNDRELAKRLGQQGRERSRDFAWSKQIVRIYTLLKNSYV